MHPASPDPEPPPTADALAQPRAGACRVPVRGWGGSRALRACLAGPCLLMVTLLITLFRSKPFIIVRAPDRANLKYPSMEGSGGRRTERGNETTRRRIGEIPVLPPRRRATGGVPRVPSCVSHGTICLIFTSHAKRREVEVAPPRPQFKAYPPRRRAKNAASPPKMAPDFCASVHVFVPNPYA